MEMAGASISICRMADQEMKQWIDMPVHTPFYTRFNREYLTVWLRRKKNGSDYMP